MANVRWRLAETPNPSEMGFVVILPQDTVAQNPSAIPLIPADGDPSSYPLFKELGIVNNVSLGWIPDAALAADNRFGLYVFCNTTKNDLDVMFWYAKPKTAAEANAPFRKTTWMANHRWPPILLSVDIEPDYGSPRSFATYTGTDIGTGFGPSYNDQVVYIPDVSEGSRFLKEEFYSPTPFNIPQYPVPVATSVTYRMPGGEANSFPECLHDKITIESMFTAQLKIVAGVSTVLGTVMKEQIFPATNFIAWAPYVLSDTQEQQGGGWYRVRTRVFPPPVPDSVRSEN